MRLKIILLRPDTNLRKAMQTSASLDIAWLREGRYFFCGLKWDG
jgi:hypothetical protein